MVATTPKTRKAKGKNFQNWVVDKILERFDSLTERDVRSTTMGDSGVDIKLSEEAVKLYPYSTECKAVESINLWECWKQAQTNKEDGTSPVLFIKRNHTDPIVVVDALHFLDLVKKANDV